MKKVVRLSIFTVLKVVLLSIAWTNHAVLPKDHDVLNLTKVRCSRHTYISAVIHEHIFDKKIVWLSGCHQRIGLLPKGNTMNTCVRACIRAPACACVLASVYGRE